MQFSCLPRFTGAVLAAALCAAPVAAASPVQSTSPLAVVAIYGSQASAQALCGSAGTAAAGAAAAGQAQPGCVLPAIDAPPAVAVEPPPATAATNFGLNPILTALAGLALLGGILAALDDDDDIEFSPA